MTKPRRVVRTVLATALVAASVLAMPATYAYAESCVGGVDGDFNGDGVKDIAIGEAFGGVRDTPAGWVMVKYGGSDVQHQISQASIGVPGEPEDGDMFGIALARYDYNRDGCSDLVVGAPGEALGSKKWAGMVTVIPGSPNGLLTQESFALHQNTPGVPGGAEPSDEFGNALAAGNTRSGEPYLVIGAPGEMIGKGVPGWDSQGAIHYLRGGINVLVHQDTPGVPGGNERDDDFGTTIVATRDHVIVASPGEDLIGNGRNREDAGTVHVFGHVFSSSGSPKYARMIHQNTTGVSGTPEAGDEFGGGDPGVSAEGGLSAVAYRPSGVSDAEAGSIIAVGVPGEDLGPHDPGYHRGDGMVHLFYVSRAGSIGQVRTLHQDTAGVAGAAEPRDILGDELLLIGDRGYGAATPAGTRLLVAVPGERADDALGAFQLFSMAGKPGDSDLWIGNGRFGLVYRNIGSNMGTTDSYLYLEEGSTWWSITMVPWANILDGASQPVRSISYDDREHGGFFGTAME